MTDLDTLERDLLAQVTAASDETALDAVRVAALGKAGEITALLKTLGKMTPDERTVEGPRINALREGVTAAIAARKAALEDEELERRLATERLDLSLPAMEAPRGSVHPVAQVMDELTEIFADLGFAVAEGPEILGQGACDRVANDVVRYVERAHCTPALTWYAPRRRREARTTAPGHP